MGHSGFGTSFRIMFALHLKVKFFFIISDNNFIFSNINIYNFESTNNFICYVFSPQHLESFECLQVFSLWTFNTDSEITMFDFIFSVKLWMMLPHGLWPDRKPQDQILTLQETSGPDPDLTGNGLEEWPNTCTYLPWTFCKSWTSPCSMEGGRGHSTLFP